MSERNVWLIDDDLFQNKANILTLERSFPHFRVTAFKSPIDPLKIIQTIKDDAPDIIFLDLDMPEMTGQEFLEHLSKLVLDIKVIVLTSNKNQQLLDKVASYSTVIKVMAKPLRSSDIRKLEL